jgi:hypothetical protein
MRVVTLEPGPPPSRPAPRLHPVPPAAVDEPDIPGLPPYVAAHVDLRLDHPIPVQPDTAIPPSTVIPPPSGAILSVATARSRAAEAVVETGKIAAAGVGAGVGALILLLTAAGMRLTPLSWLLLPPDLLENLGMNPGRTIG